VEKIRLDWMVTDPASFNIGMTHRCGPAGAADLLIGNNDSPCLQRLVRWDRLCKHGSLRMKDWNGGGHFQAEQAERIHTDATE
jgi:hypothetical protein